MRGIKSITMGPKLIETGTVSIPELQKKDRVKTDTVLIPQLQERD